jgi:hypothetical protein
MKKLRFPRGGRDDLGIRYGDAEERLKNQRAKGDEEVYESVVDYDPVLRSHCRL